MSEHLPEISVVVPAYNAAHYLLATMTSILAQEGVSLELIVVDDCSTDETPELVANIANRDSRIRYLRMPSNCGGPAAPRNFGVSMARGIWIALCDADDLWHPRKLRIQLDWAVASGADLVCAAIQDFRHSDGTTLCEAEIPTKIVTHYLSYWQMLMKNRIATSSVLCTKGSLLLVGGFNTARELSAVEDYDLWLRLMEHPGFRVLRIDLPLVAYRILPTSLSANKWRHALKVMNVLALASERREWRWAFPVAAQFLFIAYGCLSLYWVFFRGLL